MNIKFSYYIQTVLVTAIHSANIDIYISHNHHSIIRHRCIKNGKCHVERFDLTDDGTRYCQHNQSSQYMCEDFWTGHCPSAFICTTQGTILNIFHHKVTCLVLASTIFLLVTSSKTLKNPKIRFFNMLHILCINLYSIYQEPKKCIEFDWCIFIVIFSPTSFSR